MRVLRVISCLAVLFFVCNLLIAAEDTLPAAPATKPPHFQTWLLPPDVLKKQLTPEWIPITLDDFERFVRDFATTRSTNTTCSVTHAEYSATFAEGALRSGVASWKVRRSGPSAAPLLLAPLNVSLQNVTWRDRPAISGSSPQTAGLSVLVDRREGDLQGEWECSGKHSGGSWLFDLQLPAAQVTQIKITIPTGLKLRVSDPHAIVMAPLADKGEWNVLLGNQSHCELIISAADVLNSLPPQFTYHQDNQYLIGPEGIKLRAAIKMNVSRGVLTTIPLLVDPELQVVSVTYGTDFPLNWKAKESEKGRTIEIAFPEPVSGQARTVQVLMHCPIRLSQDWRLPALHIEGGLAEEILCRLQPQAPLEIKTITPANFRQMATEATGDILFSYRAIRPDAYLTLNIGSPPLKAVARVSGVVRLEREAWLADYEVEWDASSGIEYSLPIKIQNGWEIIDVRSASRRGIQENSTWEVQPLGPGAGQQIRMNLQDPLRPGAPQRVLLQIRRPVSSIDKPFPLPYVEPLLVDDLSMLLMLTSDPQFRVFLEPDTTFEVLESGQIPAPWAANPFWSQHSRDRDSRQMLLRLNAPSPKGELSLRSTETLLASQGLVDVKWNEDQILEDFGITVHPRNSRVDKVLVYLTESGGATSWRLEPSGGVTLDASRLPVSRHGAWEVSATGELWELRFSVPQNGPFVIRGSRSRPQSAEGRMTQIFLPQSETFQGEVRLRLAPQSALRFEPTGGDLSEGNSGQDNSSDERQFREVVWRYHKLEDQLRYRSNDYRLQSDVLLSGTLEFSVRMGPPSPTPDLFQARYQFPAEIPLASFRWKLPPEVQMLDVLVDGQQAEYASDSTEYALVGTERLRGKVIQLTFTNSNPVFQDRVVFVPAASLPVSRCEWRLFLSDGLALQEWPHEIGTPDRDPGRIWNQFWPAKIVTKTNSQKSASEEEMSRFERPGDSLWQSVTMNVPEKFKTRLWDRRRFTLFAWQSWIGSLLFWLILRLTITERIRNQLLIHFLWGGILVALWLPHGWSFVLWALLLGGVISAVVPLWWLPPAWNTKRSISPNIPVISTHLLPPSQLGVLAFVLVLSQWNSALAQQPSENQKNTASTAAEKQATLDSSGLKVLIPADENGVPIGMKPTVYLSPEWQRWIDLRSTSPQIEPSYFINSAKYSLRVSENSGKPSELVATYEIDIPKRATPVKVSIPLSGLRFAGNDACQVNGVSTEIYASPQGKGIYLWLQPPAPKPAGSAEKTTNSGTGANASGSSNETASSNSGFVRSVVELRAIPKILVQGDFQFCEFQPPEIANSQILVQLPRPAARFEILGARGQTTKIDAGLFYRTQLGNGTHFQIRWSDSAAPQNPPAQAELTAYGLADVSPLLTSVHYRLDVQPTAGELQNLVLSLPEKAQLRELKGTNVSGYRESGVSNGDLQVLVEFAQPQKSNVQIELSFVLQTDVAGEDFSIPPIRLLDSQKNPELRLFAHQLALRAAPDYSFDVSSDVGEHSIPITIESFLETWGKETAKPQAAFRILDAVPLKFLLRSQAASRRIESLKYQANITPQRVNVVWDAEIEIGASVPVFQHRLEVDPQIQIQQISVTGDDANRLLYWTRTGDRVTLYLRERTIGRQRLHIEGRFPLKLPGDMDCPEIRLLQCQPGREEWSFSMSPEIAAEVILSDGFRRLPNQSEDDTLMQGRLLLGTYETVSEKRRLRLRVMRNVPKLSCLTLTTIEQRESNWKYGIQLLFRVQEGIGTQFEISIPETLPQFQVEAKDARVLQKKQPDGSTIVTLLLKSPTRELFQASVTADLPIPRETLWKVPTVVPLQVLTLTPYLLVNPPELLERDSERTTGLRETKQLPELQRLAPAVLISQSRIFESTSPQWILPLKGHSASNSQASISWVEDLLWINAKGSSRGRTQLLMAGSPMAPLEFSLPQGLRLDRVEVNGLIQSPEQKEDRYSLSFDRSQSTAIVTLDWSEVAPRNLYRLVNIDVTLPRILTHVPTTRHPIVVRLPGTILPETARNLNSRWWNWALLRLETLSEFLGKYGREDRAFGTTLRQELNDLKQLVESGRIKPPSGALQTRYSALIRKTHELEVDELGRTQDSESQQQGEILAGLRQLTPDTVAAYALAGNSNQFQFQQFEKSWILAPFTLLILIFGRRLLSWMSRLRFTKVLEHSPVLGWLVCAICWYFWATPAWVSLFLLLLAGLHAFVSRFAPPLPEESVEFQLQETP